MNWLIYLSTCLDSTKAGDGEQKKIKIKKNT